MKKNLLSAVLLTLSVFLFAEEKTDYDFYFKVVNNHTENVEFSNYIEDSSGKRLWQGDVIVIKPGKTEKVCYNIKELEQKYGNDKAALICDFGNFSGWLVPVSDASENTCCILTIESTADNSAGFNISRSGGELNAFIGDYDFTNSMGTAKFTCEKPELISSISFYKTKQYIKKIDSSCQLLKSKKLDDGSYSVDTSSIEMDWYYILISITGKNSQKCVINKYYDFDNIIPEIKIDDKEISSQKLKIFFYDERMNKDSIDVQLFDENGAPVKFESLTYQKNYASFEKDYDFSFFNPGKYILKAICSDNSGNICQKEYSFEITRLFPDDENPDCAIEVINALKSDVIFVIGTVDEQKKFIPLSDRIGVKPGEKYLLYKDSGKYSQYKDIVIAVYMVRFGGLANFGWHYTGSWESLSGKTDNIQIKKGKSDDSIKIVYKFQNYQK